MKSGRVTKTCTRCGYTGDRFKGPGRSTSDGYDHICMDCVLDGRSKLRHYRTDVVLRWKRMKGCAKCGYNTNPVALELNHKDPNLKYKRGASRGYKAEWSMKRIKEELAKCEVLCSNCHKIETHNQMVSEGIRRS